MEPCSLQHLIQVSQFVAFMEEKECIEEEDKDFTKPTSAKWTRQELEAALLAKWQRIPSSNHKNINSVKEQTLCCSKSSQRRPEVMLSKL